VEGLGVLETRIAAAPQAVGAGVTDSTERSDA
jgi:hypothetical protein